MTEILWWVLLIGSLVGMVYAWRHGLKKLAAFLVLILVVLIAGRYVADHWFGIPHDYARLEDQFKYGSVGADHFMTRGIPFWIWRVLPVMIPPSSIKVSEEFKPRNGKNSYEAFGLISENHHAVRLKDVPETELIDRPIGFSKRKAFFGMDFVGMNCAFCHVSTLRKTPQGDREIILGMPANTVDIEKFFIFLFYAAEDKRFTPSAVVTAIRDQNPGMTLTQRVGYWFAAVLFQYKVMQLKEEFAFIDPKTDKARRLPHFGPGRVEPWAPGKVALAHLPVDPPGGIVDHTSLWNQKARDSMRLHWDGNIEVLGERNIIAALVVVGPRANYLDWPRMQRVTEWVRWLPAPRYEDRMNGNSDFPINWKIVDRGRALFRNYCASCHASDGDRIGRVEPVDAFQLRTDPERMNAFTPELAQALNRIETKSWKLRSFQPQTGYVNSLLDGIWARAPYLHNGSVPTLHELLKKPEDRTPQFCRGNDLYDWKNVGFVSDLVSINGVKSCGEFFLYDTKEPGNSNQGHLYGTDLDKYEEKGAQDALLEYLKTL